VVFTVVIPVLTVVYTEVPVSVVFRTSVVLVTMVVTVLNLVETGVTMVVVDVVTEVVVPFAEAKGVESNSAIIMSRTTKAEAINFVRSANKASLLLRLYYV
jgi:hypothetical protein